MVSLARALCRRGQCPNLLGARRPHALYIHVHGSNTFSSVNSHARSRTAKLHYSSVTGSAAQAQESEAEFEALQGNSELEHNAEKVDNVVDMTTTIPDAEKHAAALASAASSHGQSKTTLKSSTSDGVASAGHNAGTDEEIALLMWKDYADRLDPTILDTMKTIFKYQHVTKVQASILDMMPIQNDLLIRSKTGTGKTLAFLVPALQRALEEFKRRDLSGSQLKKYANANASTLIISPTRELANQIATEARRLVAYRGSNMKALCLVGGDSKREQLKLMRRERNDFVVATPGRLLDMLRNEHDFADLMPNMQTLILDEADTLLELGFRRDLEEILQFIPKTRQTYMFSATVSRDVRQIARSFLGKDHTYLNTVSKDDQDSHLLIKQEYICRPAAEHMKTVLSLIISEQLKNPNAKVIVFFQTTRMTMLYASAFKTLRRLYPNEAFQQFDIHAQRSQDSRSKVSAAFRAAGAGSVLFTTDVSARGVDYPDVSLVIQVGTPNTRDLYIHRVGRTGRAGKPGHNILVMHEYERSWLKNLSDVPITEKNFPDSEIALGEPQQKVFGLMKKICPPAMVEDTYRATAGALLPRRSDLRTSEEAILAEYGGWYRDLAGQSATPPYVESRGGGGRRGPRSSGGSHGDGGGFRRGRMGQSDEMERFSGKDRLMPGRTEWRPLRPTEQRRAQKPQYDYNRYSTGSGRGENEGRRPSYASDDRTSSFGRSNSYSAGRGTSGARSRPRY